MGGERRSWTGFIWTVVLLMLLAVSVQADAADRRATAEEQEFYRSIQDLLAAALPGDVPDGWEISDQTETSELEFVPDGQSGKPISVEYYLEWTNVSVEQKVQADALAKISEFAEKPPVSEAQIHSYEQLAAKVAEAKAADDDEAVRRLQREMERQAAVLNKAFEPVDVKIAEIDRTATATDVRALMHLSANRFFQPLETDVQSLTVAGYPAFRTKGYCSSPDSRQEGATIVFMGDGWLALPDNSGFQFRAKKDAPAATLQTIVVEIVADPKRTADIIAMIDWQALQTALEQ